MRPEQDESQFRVAQAHDLFKDLAVYLQQNVERCDDPQVRAMFAQAAITIHSLSQTFGMYDSSEERSA